MKKIIQFAFLLLFLFAMHACNKEAVDSTITIQFDTQGGNYIDPITINILEFDGEFEEPSKEGYKFISWSLESEGVAFDYDFKNINNQTIILYAVWEKQFYDLIFMDEDETILHQESIQFGAFLEDSYLEAPTKLGYTFNGWDIDLPNTMPKQDVIVKATYVINSYKISFETNGADTFAALTKNYNDNFTVTTPTKEGHTFEGWFLDAEFETPFTSFVVPAFDITLYAKWERQSFNLIFMDEDETILYQTSILYDDFLEDSYLDAPKKIGYTFNGWDIDLPNRMPGHDVVAKATYNINSYKITFETNGADLIADITKTYNESFAVSEPSIEGYAFMGWFSDENFETPFTDFIVPAHDLTLYAKWEKQTFTITFDTMGGDFYDTITASYMDPIELPVPEILGYVFEGWYLDYDYIQAFDSDFMGLESIHLVAKWVKAEYQVNYYLLGGINHEDNPLTVDGTKEIPLYEPTMEGFTFLGWYLNQHFMGEPVISIEKGVRTDIELHAKWQMNQYDLTYVMSQEPIGDDYGVLNPGELVIEVLHSYYEYSLILTSHHRVFTYGRTTIGDLKTYQYPIDVTGYFDLLEGEYIDKIFTGDSHSAVLTSEKRLLMWGSNEYGQIALNSWDYGSEIPVDVTNKFPLFPTEEIDLVALGARHTIVTTTHGRIFTLGLNNEGQLGFENTGYSIKNVPIEITLAFELDDLKFEHFTYIFAESNRSLVVTSENRVFVFGASGLASLGTGEVLVNYEAPYEITEAFNFSSDEDVVTAKIASSSGVLITSKNRIFTWGYNGQGELGLGYSSSVREPVTEVINPFTLEDGEYLVDASAGDVTIILTSNGRLFITGYRDLLLNPTRPNNNRDTFAERTNFFDLDDNEKIIKLTNTSIYLRSVVTSHGNVLSWGQTYRMGVGDHPDFTINIPIHVHLVRFVPVSVATYYFTEEIDAFDYEIAGYQFLGWFLDSSLETPFDLTNMPGEDVVVYGHYVELGT